MFIIYGYGSRAITYLIFVSWILHGFAKYRKYRKTYRVTS